jgi:hypothetical protein
MGLDLATAAFWLFLAVVVGSLIWRKGLQRRETLITLRVAIEKGLPLDDPHLRALLAATPQPRGVAHDFLLVLGGIVAAGGLCLFVLPLFGAEAAPLLAVGVCAEIMAAALIVLWWIFTRRAQRPAA